MVRMLLVWIPVQCLSCIVCQERGLSPQNRSLLPVFLSQVGSRAAEAHGPEIKKLVRVLGGRNDIVWLRCTARLWPRTNYHASV